MRYRYQRAFIDFFEDQLVTKKYDIKDLVDEFMFQGKEPLVNGLVSGRRFTLSQRLTIADIHSRTPSHSSRLRLRTSVKNSRDRSPSDGVMLLRPPP
jgi:hypothetical protein